MGSIIDWILDFLYKIAAAAISFLPDSPFATQSFKNALSSFSDLMSNINYFIPFGDMFVMAGVYIAAVLVWYGVRWILRLARYIE